VRSLEIPELVESLRPAFEGVLVCISRSWGGLEQVAAADAIELADQGLEVRMLCLERSPIHEHLTKNGKVETLPLEFTPRNNFDLNLRKVIARLVSENVNVLHLHQPSLLGSFSPFLWRNRGVAFFATRHIMNNHFKTDFYHRALYSRLDALLAISETVKQNILDTHAIKETRVKVVNLGLDFDRFNPKNLNPSEQRARWGADEKTTVIGLVGRIDPAKGQATLIRAAAGLSKALPKTQKVKFVIVGEETLGSVGRHLDELKAMVQQFRLEDSVFFAGYQENIPEVTRALDLFVMPSRQEAFGLVAIEALAMECPIIISNSGSAEEIVGKEEYGLMVRPNDAFDLQTKIRVLLDRPDLRKEMGQKGRQHVMKNYDRRGRLRQTLALYERALRRRGHLER
jgi:glycosyltransferase involved in cell wall biosynthesis